MFDKYGSELFGLVGSLFSLSWLEKRTMLMAFMTVASGCACAIVVAPIATHYIAPPDVIRDYVSAFFGLVFGVSGLAIINAIHTSARAVRDWLPETIKKYLNRKAGL